MEKMNLERFGIMLDCSRNGVMTVDSVKRFIDTMVRMGYNCLLLYTEDTYEIKSQPYFGHQRGRYSTEEIKEIDSYAISKGVELIPCIQTLAHLERIFRWGVYDNVRDTGDILLVDEEKTYDLIDDMFKALSESYTTRIVNIGMDEAGMLGRGKYLDRHGLVNRTDIIFNHLNRVSEIAKKYGFTITMWGDMFLGSDLFVRMMQDREYTEEELWEVSQKKELVPENVKIVYWDYYSLKDKIYDSLLSVYETLKDDVWFAGGLWCWNGFAPHNAFSEKQTELAFRHCANHGVKNIFLTMWGDNGNECSKFSLLPSMYYASQLVKGVTDEEEIKKGFEKEFGIKYDDFMLIDLPSTEDFTPDDINDAGKLSTAEKYLLFCDCLMGLFDNTVDQNTAKQYRNLATKMSDLITHPEFGYLFDTISSLCEVLSVKADIGVRTRKAYLDKDIDTLKSIIVDYDTILSNLDKFYTAFEKQWMQENKPQGFEVQDARIGGLIQRVKHCKARLLQYINGEIGGIGELEEPVLDVACREEDNKPLQYNNWAASISVTS